MRRFAQLDANVVTGILIAARAPDVLPEGRTFVDVTDVNLPAIGSTYDEGTKVFTPPAAPTRIKMLSKADVIGQLLPATWAELNKFQPTALGIHAGGTPYNDSEVFWAVSVFTSAAKDFALNDPRIANLIGRFVTKNIITTEERDLLLGKLATVAR